MKVSAGYSRLQIAIHWATVMLVALNYIVSDEMGRAFRAILNGQAPEGLTPVVHVYVGLAVLALVLLRAAVRLVQGAPEASHAGPELLRRAAAAAHAALYALLVLVPALGVLAWYGKVHAAGDAHVLAMNALIALAGLHGLAALWHHYALRDGVLLRMLRPGGGA